MIANVFVDSQDDIRLNLLLMYKTIMIMIIIIVSGPIIIGLSNWPAISPQRHHLHTHAQMRIKAKVYFGHPRTVLITSFSSSRGSRTVASECRQFFETAQVKLVYCACVELVRPHSPAAEYTLGPFTYRVFCAVKFVISNVDARYARS